MPHHMVHEVLLPRKALLANLAPVRSLARMFPHVVHHVLLTGECFGTELASGIIQVLIRVMSFLLKKGQ